MLDGWDQLYRQRHFVYGCQPNAYLVSHASRLKAGTRGLLVADGEGRNAVWLAQMGLTVVSVDFSLVAQQKGRILAKRRGVDVEFLHRDVIAWDCPASAFDFVGSFYFHLTPRDRQTVHAKLIRALTPGGLLLVEAFHQSQPRRPLASAIPSEYYTIDDLRQDFQGLAEIEISQVRTRLDEGPQHRGVVEVVRAAVRKL